jgi:hypothetical protein
MTSLNAVDKPADSNSHRDEDAALLDRVVSEPAAISLSTASAADLEAQLSDGMPAAVEIATLEDADVRIKVLEACLQASSTRADDVVCCQALEAQLATSVNQEAERTHTRLTQQAQQHEAFFTEQLAQAQSEHKATLSQVISDLRASLGEQVGAPVCTLAWLYLALACQLP